MVELSSHGDGTLLPIRVQPGARRNEIRGWQDGALKVAVTAAPEKGKANKALIELLSKQLAVRKSQIEVLSGETSRDKRLLIQAIAPTELAARIQRVLPPCDP